MIEQLKKLLSTATPRAARNIENLINRIEYFESTGETEKLENCKAEAELWLNK